MVAVELPLPTLERFRVLIARVVHATPQPEGTWLVGCSFINKLQEAELGALLGTPEGAG
jgi:hypothetical protein